MTAEIKQQPSTLWAPDWRRNFVQPFSWFPRSPISDEGQEDYLQGICLEKTLLSRGLAMSGGPEYRDLTSQLQPKILSKQQTEMTERSVTEHRDLHFQGDRLQEEPQCLSSMAKAQPASPEGIQLTCILRVSCCTGISRSAFTGQRDQQMQSP